MRRQLESVGKQLKAANEQLADLEEVRSPDVRKLDQENQNLLEKLQQISSENESLLKKLQQTRAELEEVRSQKTDAPTSQFPNFPKLRDRVLAELKLGRQAPGYKAASKALDSFIKQLEVK